MVTICTSGFILKYGLVLPLHTVTYNQLDYFHPCLPLQKQHLQHSVSTRLSALFLRVYPCHFISDSLPLYLFLSTGSLLSASGPFPLLPGPCLLPDKDFLSPRLFWISWYVFDCILLWKGFGALTLCFLTLSTWRLPSWTHLSIDPSRI